MTGRTMPWGAPARPVYYEKPKRLRYNRGQSSNAREVTWFPLMPAAVEALDDAASGVARALKPPPGVSDVMAREEERAIIGAPIR